MSEDKAQYNPRDGMMDLKGKAYLPVAERIVWFRNDYPEGTIETSIVSIDEETGSAIVRARVTTGKGGIAEATGDETRKDFPQGWIGKAETKAVGRALGYLGYGTAAAGFEEGQRVVDAPQERRPAPRPAPARQDAPRPLRAAEPAPATTEAPDDWTAFWSWARERGYRSRLDLNNAAGQDTNDMTPSQIRALIEQRAVAS